MSLWLNITQSTDSIAQLAKELNLGPLQEPEAVQFSFDTIGWPILAITLAISIIIFAIVRIIKYRHNHYRREALADLKEISTGQKDLSQGFVILKRTAILAYDRDRVGALTGSTWLQFLEDNATGVQMKIYERDIENLIYKGIAPEKEVASALLSNIEKWIRTHAAR